MAELIWTREMVKDWFESQTQYKKLRISNEDGSIIFFILSGF